MNRLLDLPTWMKVFIVLAIVGALYGAFKYWKHGVYQSGWDAREVVAVEEKRRLNADAKEKFAEEQLKAQGIQTNLQDKLYKLDVQSTKERADHEKVVANYESRLRSGADRMSIAIKRAGCPVPGVPESVDLAAAATVSDEARVDLMPETAVRILRIASDSADLVRDYNELVDIYSAARTACNAR